MKALYLVILTVMLIISITTIEIIALSKGVNGTGLSLSIGSISAISGFVFKSIINKKEFSK